MVTIRDLGLCPCPRCLVPQQGLEAMGQIRDEKIRAKPRTVLVDDVKLARKFIYEFGYGISSVHVERLLKATSAVPTLVSSLDCIMNGYKPRNTLECVS